jgi:hypothetical protein
MTEGVPRFMLVLAAIVAIVAISVGIRDHAKQQETKAPASTSTPTLADSNLRKKSTSAKTRGARKPASEEPASEGNDSTTSGPPQAIWKSPFTKAGAEATGVNDAPNTLRAQAANDEREAALGRGNRGNELGPKTTKPPVSDPNCLPLPNLTGTRDVDAYYYQNWAREYWCYDSLQSVIQSASRK